YPKEGSNLCCKKCQPGYRLKEHCSENKETVCEPCKPNTYLESWNYAHNCLPCKKCNPRKNLKEIRTCTSTQNAVCVCKENTFCTMGYNAPECASCQPYRACGPGHGVSVQGKVCCSHCLNAHPALRCL
uniref:TNFR-Cys domain-containing protein n=1 Tax=Oryzias melastigma TaxID=30732 RepID=A0A3B3CQX8_ORYME